MWDRFLKACRGEAHDTTPVWFMRQAGRYMPEYRAIREKHTLLEICRQPDIATEVTLQPVRAYPVDAAILFADILLPLEPMGAKFEFAKGEGPVFETPIRTAKAIEDLRIIDPKEDLAHVLQAVKQIRGELDGKTPLIGFAGAPFTLASYLIEGGKSSNYLLTKKMMYQEPEMWNSLMSKLSEVVRRLLRAQIEAGAQAVQLFDSWIGSLSITDYELYIYPHVHGILSDLEDTGVPIIHFGTGTASLLPLMSKAGGHVIGVDWRTPLSEARLKVGPNKSLQGNLDPIVLDAPEDILYDRIQRIVVDEAKNYRHIFNLGHGILPHMSPDAVKRCTELVHELGTKRVKA